MKLISKNFFRKTCYKSKQIPHAFSSCALTPVLCLRGGVSSTLRFSRCVLKSTMNLLQFAVLQLIFARVGFSSKESHRLAMRVFGWYGTLNAIAANTPTQLLERLTPYYTADMVVTMHSNYPLLLRILRVLHHSVTLFVMHREPDFVAPLLRLILFVIGFVSYPVSTLKYFQPNRQLVVLDGFNLAASGLVRSYISLVASLHLFRSFRLKPHYIFLLICVCFINIINAHEIVHLWEKFKSSLQMYTIQELPA